ncbi:BMP family lipoprotein [Protaetiibacter mangrovi]|uniref:BMP family ABC transporter substrate-binding protein n=1 Tax=Protaetiibacter mangrovi TaxID=2970926 RepID=A0ABT1ZCN4_9MICO|nr:BMP family ABC transporter substrate-binding protein [Protaetiibacter mangrovi]MCS0498436.1 BMP family ABC transporter substrate-binding protein [Protaetiibacter mangrovi]
MQRRTTLTGALAALAVTALALTGCGTAPEAPDDSATTTDFLPCAASDLTGFDDGDFNELSYNGVKQAADELGADVKTAESSAEDQYTSNVASLVDLDCDLIVTVGFALANATRDSARENPDVEYALIDSTVTDDDFQTIELDNVKPVLFDTAQAAVLAGYLAAGATSTGTVGTYGGMPFPSVTIFMDGFADGIAFYNEKHGTSVTLIGWDKASQNGTFVGSFDDQLGAKTITAGLIDQGADIIMPVAGTLYMSSVEAFKDRGVEGAIVGVNSDVYDRSPEDGAYFLTSVLKNLTLAAHEVTIAAADGEFDNTPYVGTLENGGVGIAPTHDWEAKLPASLLDEVAQLQADIISGAFTVDSPSSPRV